MSQQYIRTVSLLIIMIFGVLLAQEDYDRIPLGDELYANDLTDEEAMVSRFDELMQEAQLILVDAIVADKSADTLAAAYYFDLLFEAMSDIEQLPFIDELQLLEFNRFINAAISFYEDDSKTLEKIETSLTVFALRDELSRYTRSLPPDLVNTADYDYSVTGSGLPITHNEHVARIMEFFKTQGHRHMQARLNRLSRYSGIITPILEEEGIPQDLIFLAFIESGLNPIINSPAQAKGMWQFISATGRRYDLQRDWWLDERRDIEKSTRAAARYLSDLYEEFGDWYLAMAAYNTGEGRVRRAIRIHQTRDYWKLYVLPRETRSYIPNIMAAFLIAQDPEKHGFVIDPLPAMEWEVVPVDRSITFDVLAQIAETDADTFKVLNPELRQNATPPTKSDEPYQFKIPIGSKAAFERNYDAIASKIGPVLADVQVRRHRVKRGESVYSISKRYGVPMQRIAQANNLGNWHKLRLGQILSIPVTTSGVASRRSTVPSNPNAKLIYYTVRPGDTLGEISEAHNVGLSVLRSWNGIRSSRSSSIRVGQKLKIYLSSTPSAPALAPVVPAGMVKQLYTVRSGDTLSQIAEAHKIGLSSLRQWNGLRAGTAHVRVGQKIIIYRPEG